MPGNLTKSLFVTGTDTGVGKTVVSAALVAGLGFDYWKPVQSGLEEETDTVLVRRITGAPADRFHPETYRLTRPLSPHASAAHDGVRIELEAFSLPDAGGNGVIVEGAGGVMVPLNDRYFMLDLMIRLGLPVVVVARSGLGTINHTLLSLETLRRNNLEIRGVVLNGQLNAGNREAIEHFAKVRVTQVEPLAALNRDTLLQAFAGLGNAIF